MGWNLYTASLRDAGANAPTPLCEIKARSAKPAGDPERGNREGRIVTRSTLIKNMKQDQDEDLDERSVDSHIKRIREKLNALKGDLGKVILTHYSIGYLLSS